MNRRLRVKQVTNLLLTLGCWSSFASAQSLSLDNVPPFPLAVSASVAAVSISPASGNVTARSLTGGASQCTGSSQPGDFEKMLKGGNTGLMINQSGRIELLSTPINYHNRTIGQGRRSVILRVSQPLLCMDFAAAPVGSSNPVGLKITDSNNETTVAMYGGISAYNYFTNGVNLSSFSITSNALLACCHMLPANNASCFQGNNGGPSAAPMTVEKGSSTNLNVIVSGPGGVLPGNDLTYSILVSNTGSTALSGVRVRDWFTKSSSGSAGSFSNGNWSCAPTLGASCGASSGTGNIALTQVVLPAGSSVIITVTRTLSGFAALGSPYYLSAAAFAPPAANELGLGDNQDVLQGFAELTDDLFESGFE